MTPDEALAFARSLGIDTTEAEEALAARKSEIAEYIRARADAPRMNLYGGRVPIDEYVEQRDDLMGRVDG